MRENKERVVYSPLEYVSSSTAADITNFVRIPSIPCNSVSILY